MENFFTASVIRPLMTFHPRGTLLSFVQQVSHHKNTNSVLEVFVLFSKCLPTAVILSDKSWRVKRGATGPHRTTQCKVDFLPV
jgi:hypothetical protein